MKNILQFILLSIIMLITLSAKAENLIDTSSFATSVGSCQVVSYVVMTRNISPQLTNQAGHYWGLFDVRINSDSKIFVEARQTMLRMSPITLRANIQDLKYSFDACKYFAKRFGLEN